MNGINKVKVKDTHLSLIMKVADTQILYLSMT